MQSLYVKFLRGGCHSMQRRSIKLLLLLAQQFSKVAVLR
jgi:hypothetical protein